MYPQIYIYKYKLYISYITQCKQKEKTIKIFYLYSLDKNGYLSIINHLYLLLLYIYYTTNNNRSQRYMKEGKLNNIFNALIKNLPI